MFARCYLAFFSKKECLRTRYGSIVGTSKVFVYLVREYFGNFGNACAPGAEVFLEPGKCLRTRYGIIFVTSEVLAHQVRKHFLNPGNA